MYNNIEISIVTTLYHSEEHIKEFYDRIVRSAESIAENIELIIVNDGSPDNSVKIVNEICSVDSRVTLIDLSRNFGHHKAMMTGLKYACGGYVFLIDSDLEEPPELLVDFVEQICKSDLDVVYGVQQRRKGGLFERLSGACFYWLFNKLSDINLPNNVLTVRLMTLDYVKSLLEYKEYDPMFHCLALITGYNQQAVPVKKGENSVTTYSLKKKLSLALNSITSFSNKPLYLIFYIGSIISGMSIFYILYLIVKYFIVGTPIIGWTSLMASLWLIGGLILFFLGVASIYLSKIFLEVKNRPFTTVKNIINKNNDNLL